MMIKIDYMKVIDILAATLGMKKIGMQFPDKSIVAMEFNMTGPDNAKKFFRLTVKDFSLELTVLKNCFLDLKFDKWVSAFEYELEQALLQNITIHVHEGESTYTLTIAY